MKTVFLTFNFVNPIFLSYEYNINNVTHSGDENIVYVYIRIRYRYAYRYDKLIVFA